MTVFKTMRGRALWFKESDHDVEPYIDDFPAEPRPVMLPPARRNHGRGWAAWAFEIMWMMFYVVGIFACAVLLVAALVVVKTGVVHWGALVSSAYGREGGQYDHSELKAWFNSLGSRKGNCCSIADGRAITDADTDMRGNHFWVRVDGEWIEVPDDALVMVPNRIGTPVVWPMRNGAGKIAIRCFLPGSGA